MKRGQVTLFIIAGVLIVFLAGAGFILLKNSGFFVKNPAEEGIPVNVYVDECLRQTVRKGLISLAAKGGYHSFPGDSLQAGGYKTAYYYDKGVVQVPSIETLESEFSAYVDSELPKCTDWEIYKKQGYGIRTSYVGAKAKIADEKIVVDVEYEITADVNDQSYRFDKFSTEVKTSYKKSYEIGSDIIRKMAKNPKYKDMTDLLNQDQLVEVYPYPDRLSEAYTILGSNYVFIFAARFS